MPLIFLPRFLLLIIYESAAHDAGVYKSYLSMSEN